MANTIPLGTLFIEAVRGEPKEDAEEPGDMLMEGEGDSIGGGGGVASFPHSRSVLYFGISTGAVVGGTEVRLVLWLSPTKGWAKKAPHEMRSP